MKRNEGIYLNHVLDSINTIEKSIKNLSRKDFSNNKDILDATLRRIEVIGEAVKNISPETRKKYPKIEWKKIAGTRDVLIHAYFSIDIDLVWKIIKEDLPKLKKDIEKIIKDIS